MATIFVAVLLIGCGDSGPPSSTEAGDAPADGDTERWFASWGTAIYTTYPKGPLTRAGINPSFGLFTNDEAVDQSFRMMVRPATGGEVLRLHFSNAFGSKPLLLQSVSVAKRALLTGPATAGAPVPVTFGGQASVTIPEGQEVTSDAASLSFAAGSDVAVSFHVPGPTGPMSWHPEAFTSQYASLPKSGDVTSDALGVRLINLNRGWFFLSGLDVQAAEAVPVPPAIAFFGDSITDGFGSIPELNQRYPDYFARRLRAAGITAGVVNLGINSNTVTPVSDATVRGAPGVERFARDALGRSRIKSVLILEGTNDLAVGKSAEEVYAGLVTMAGLARAEGVCVVVSTVLPRNDPSFLFDWNAATEEPQRQRLNEMILASTDFDATLDLAAAVASPGAPNQPFQPYFVEGLHPNSLGYQVMADAVPLESLLPPPFGRCRS